MRTLTAQEIEGIINKNPKAKRISVENFLTTMGDSRDVAMANLGYDTKSYKWNIATVRAIAICLAMAGGRPEYMPVMHLAAAFVTDEGGITSHAAIVSRELNIPCVIGTKISTEVFRDGDILEVKASHGIVRRVVK